jgi:hypothetical protein
MFSLIQTFPKSFEIRKVGETVLLIMAKAAEPTVILSHLHHTDGSATFSQNGYTVIGAVNGPIEVQRRDELPEEAAVDVIVRPAAGVGGERLVSLKMALF